MLLRAVIVVDVYIYVAFIEKNPVEQVPRGWLSCDCKKSFQFILKQKLLLDEESCRNQVLDCPSDDDGLFFE